MFFFFFLIFWFLSSLFHFQYGRAQQPTEGPNVNLMEEITAGKLFSGWLHAWTHLWSTRIRPAQQRGWGELRSAWGWVPRAPPWHWASPKAAAGGCSRPPLPLQACQGLARCFKWAVRTAAAAPCLSEPGSREHAGTRDTGRGRSPPVACIRPLTRTPRIQPKEQLLGPFKLSERRKVEEFQSLFFFFFPYCCNL